MTTHASLDALRTELRLWTGPDDRTGLVSALTPKARGVVGEPIRVNQLGEIKAYYNDRQSNNLRNATSIYTVQGLELDYVGLSWGADLVWRSGRWVSQLEKAESILRALDGEAALRLLMNRYWVLQTRAIKGLAIYCTDTETAAYVQLVTGSAGGSV